MSNIYLLQDSGDAVALSEQAYDSEEVLQRLLAEHPDVMGGDQMGDRTRRWLLVTREAGVPFEEAGASRWAVDHLFVDQEGTPTLVEVKRSGDTRIRREVVGQMLDYAANAVSCWPAALIRSRFEQSCDARQVDPIETLAEFLHIDDAPEETARTADRFWDTVDTNLRAGRMRLVFVSDAIPPELQRILEFLNAQMKPAEILAIEVKQYVGPGFRTLAPMVACQKLPTPVAVCVKWNRESFLSELRAKKGAQAVAIAEKILTWAKSNRCNVWWGAGTQIGSFYVGVKALSAAFSTWTYGRMNVEFNRLMRHPAFQEEEKRRELARRLNEIPGILIPPEGIVRSPSFDLSVLDDPVRLASFFDVMSWCIAEASAL